MVFANGKRLKVGFDPLDPGGFGRAKVIDARAAFRIDDEVKPFAFHGVDQDS